MSAAPPGSRPREIFAGNLRRIASALPDAVQAAIDDVPEGMVTPLLLAMPERVGRFAADFVEQIEREDLSYRNLPRFEGAHAISRPITSRLWEPGSGRVEVGSPGATGVELPGSQWRDVPISVTRRPRRSVRHHVSARIW